MRTTIRVVGLLVALCVGGGAGGAWIVEDMYEQLQYYRDRIAKLTDRVYQAKLHQIALFMEAGSKGAHRLLLAAGAGARAETPSPEESERSDQPDPVALITVYPASSPINAKLPGIGVLESQLLGAVALRVEARAAEGDDAKKKTTAKPDVYLIAHVTGAGPIGDASLVSVTVDDEGRLQFQQVLATRVQLTEMSRVAARLPGVIIKLADQDEDAADRPARRATVQITWREGTYRFALDLLAEGPKP
jgi:hypothetical protein